MMTLLFEVYVRSIGQTHTPMFINILPDTYIQTFFQTIEVEQRRQLNDHQQQQWQSQQIRNTGRR